MYNNDGYKNNEEKNFIITTQKQKKHFRFTFTKRVCTTAERDTLPYGHEGTTKKTNIVFFFNFYL